MKNFNKLIIAFIILLPLDMAIGRELNCPALEACLLQCSYQWCICLDCQAPCSHCSNYPVYGTQWEACGHANGICHNLCFQNQNCNSIVGDYSAFFTDLTTAYTPYGTIDLQVGRWDGINPSPLPTQGDVTNVSFYAVNMGDFAIADSMESVDWLPIGEGTFNALNGFWEFAWNVPAPVEEFGYFIGAVLFDPSAPDGELLTFSAAYAVADPPIPLNDGWSIISSYIDPINPDLPFIFDEVIIGNQLEVMLGETGIFWPSGGINTIGDWDVYQGYKIKMNEPGSITISGEIPEDKTINLDAGANYIPVLSQEYYPADDIFGQLGGGLIFGFDLNTELLWWPQGGIYTLDVFEPGKGYLVGMTQPGQATYEPTKANIQNYIPARPKVYENAPWNITKSGSTHFISVERSALGELAFGDFIGVFNTEGVCAGFTQVDEATGNILLVAYGNDFTVKANTGLADGENMTFRIFRTATGAETSATVSFDAAMPNTGFYAENGLSMIVNIKTGATSLAENDLNKIHIYPNPTNGTCTIEGVDEKINVRIFNAFGGEVYLDELNLPAKVNLSAQPKGIYFISIETGNSTFYKKLVIH